LIDHQDGVSICYAADNVHAHAHKCLQKRTSSNVDFDCRIGDRLNHPLFSLDFCMLIDFSRSRSHFSPFR